MARSSAFPTPWLAFFALVPLVFLSGCNFLRFDSHRHEAGSLVQFLYPGKDAPIVTPQIPTLHLPLRVGLAFVPSGTHVDTAYTRGSSFSEAQKTALLRGVAQEFKKMNFIQSIEIIPTSYLRAGGGFENLDQLRTIMGIDVIALISYDQVQNSGDTAWTFVYWTIIGAYIAPAQRNTTHTLVEAVVYDIASRSLLFRAPGMSEVKEHASLTRTSEELRLDSQSGFTLASTDMTKNLQVELESFRARAKEAPEQIRIVHKPGYSGGGSMGGAFAIFAVALVLGRRLLGAR